MQFFYKIFKLLLDNSLTKYNLCGSKDSKRLCVLYFLSCTNLGDYSISSGIYINSSYENVLSVLPCKQCKIRPPVSFATLCRWYVVSLHIKLVARLFSFPYCSLCQNRYLQKPSSGRNSLQDTLQTFLCQHELIQLHLLAS